MTRGEGERREKQSALESRLEICCVFGPGHYTDMVVGRRIMDRNKRRGLSPLSSSVLSLARVYVLAD